MGKDIEMSHFGIDQQQEIKDGLQAGLDVSVYAKPEFYAIQMRQIRLGLMAGLPVGIYASDKYDWFQMEEIRLGLEHKIDINKYADPSVPFDTMRQIREGLEQGIDLSAAGNLPAGKLREFRMAACEGINIGKYIKAGYDEEQLKQIRTALEEALDIDPYINPAQRGASIREIALGIGKNLDVKTYADEQMNWQQMRELRKGLEHRIDISVYNNWMYSWQQMREIRLGLEEHLPVEEYKSLMYTAKEMNKHRLKLMQEANKANDKNEETGKQYDDFTLLTDGKQMEAFIQVSAAGMKIPKKEIMSALEDCGITYGIDEAAIDDIAGNGAQDTMITIARGRQQETGKDGWYEFLFDSEAGKHPKLNEDGSVNYKNVKWFEIVRKGQKIAIYHKAEPGMPGCRVTGEKYDGKAGKEIPPVKGHGFSIAPDGVTYVADIDGRVAYKDGMLEVTSVLVLEKDTRTAGNINFNGSVYIRNSIGEGTVVKATGDIMADGFIESAQLEAGGDIILKEGTNAGGRGLLKAGGNVMGKFFENATIEAAGSVKANYCLNSNIVAGRNIIISGRYGMITGGNAYAGRKIESYNIGDADGTATLLNIGKPNNFATRLKNVEDRMKAVDRELHMLNNIYDEFVEKMKPEERNVNPVYLKVEDAIYTKNKEMSELKKVREQIISTEELYEHGKVVVNGTVYSGTSVYIKGVRWDAGTARNINIRKNGDSISVYRN